MAALVNENSKNKRREKHKNCIGDIFLGRGWRNLGFFDGFLYLC